MHVFFVKSFKEGSNNIFTKSDSCVAYAFYRFYYVQQYNIKTFDKKEILSTSTLFQIH